MGGGPAAKSQVFLEVDAGLGNGGVPDSLSMLPGIDGEERGHDQGPDDGHAPDNAADVFG